MTPQTIPTPLDAMPCQICGEQPMAMQDEFGYSVAHLCGIKMSIACNYKTVAEAVEQWNELQKAKP